MVKLYILTRTDLSNGQKAVQSIHSAITFIFKFPLLAFKWWISSNIVVLLGIENENQLITTFNQLKQLKLPIVEFREPDMQNQLTSISTILPTSQGNIFKDLPLLLREEERISDTSSTYLPSIKEALHNNIKK